jgi:predicted RNase H-like HicB family nuclease
MTRYGAIVDGKSGAYGVVIPDLPGCTAMGATIKEAVANAVGAAAAWAEVTRKEGGAIPEPRRLGELRKDAAVQAALAAGGLLVVLPWQP